MCPCPVCTGLLILLCPLLLWKKPRQWLNKKINKHHKGCAACQKAEHHHCQQEHIPCTCEKCSPHKK